MEKKIFFILLFVIGFCATTTLAQAASLKTPSNAVTTRVGNPSEGGWPVVDNSLVTQGLAGITDHHTLYDQGLQAIDVAAPMGTPVYTTLDGTISTVCEDGINACGTASGCNLNGCGYGKHVVVKSTTGSTTQFAYFGHLSEISVKVGDTVSKGTQVGLMGNTGYSTGTHLHWEFRGAPMSPPNIPTAITPLNCDYPSIPCTPMYIPTADTPSTPTAQDYWFILHRASNSENLYKGVPGDTSQSTLVKTFTVKAGRPGERPTPLPQLAGKEYWTIIAKQPDSNPETAPYFLTLDIPFDAPYYGPTPYDECGGQCNWLLPGAFGLHGVNGDNSRLSPDNPGSSGCIRHTTEDITYLYNLLDPANSQIRYYVENN